MTSSSKLHNSPYGCPAPDHSGGAFCFYDNRVVPCPDKAHDEDRIEAPSLSGKLMKTNEPEAMKLPSLLGTKISALGQKASEAWVRSRGMVAMIAFGWLAAVILLGVVSNFFSLVGADQPALLDVLKTLLITYPAIALTVVILLAMALLFVAAPILMMSVIVQWFKNRSSNAA